MSTDTTIPNAGMIEGWISPHAPLAARMATAITSAIAIVAWITLCGRGDTASSRGETRGILLANDRSKDRNAGSSRVRPERNQNA